MKRKLVQINTVFNASTGRIMTDIQRHAEKAGYDTISFVGRPPVSGEVKGKVFGNPFSFWTHVILTTLFDAQGYGSYFSTKKLIRWIKEENPDIIHLHNLHGYYLHIPSFCKFLSQEYQGKVFWTFHDCWPVTGHCAYFTSVNCDNWKKECYHCPQKTEYPISFFLDGSRRNYRMKKKWFESIPNLTIIAPSKWVKEIVQESFLKDKKIEVVNNGIDLNVFSPKVNHTIWGKYHIPQGKKILLGVANIWDKRKGLNDFIELSRAMSDDYHIVLVGLTKAQIKKMPSRITGIERTQDREELVKLYSNAHIFVNPSLEESFSLVTLEAMACGTPVIVLDTSAVKELVSEDNGVVLKNHTPDDYIRAIQVIENMKLQKSKICKHAQIYDSQINALKILKLYE
ncbi:MAG: glycosyltransferase [Lachnospiraceae bacterium]|nr:glycosyltransferase [Lachnospiraceae bacterium]MDD7628504.1 glycosyltransferase [Lachnospiraceae bacterium]MDY4120030.1 glycosyltransferase [Lachnospiraceae bacterium]